MRRIFYSFGIVLCSLWALVASAGSSAGDIRENEARRAKARYYYLAGTEANAADSLGKAFTLFRKAYETDPDYDEAAYAYGTFLMPVVSADNSEAGRARWEEAANLRRRLIDAYPADYAQVRLYAQQIMSDPTRTLNGQPVAVEAVRVLERLDSLGAPSAYHLMQLSGAYSLLEMPDSVLGVLTRYERREGSSPELLESKVGMLFRSNANDRAVKEIESYRATHPRDEFPLVLMAMLKYANEDLDSTAYYLNEAERLNPNSFEVKTRIGMLGLERQDTLLYSTKILEALELPDGEFDDKIDLLKQYLETVDFKEGTKEASQVRHAFTILHGQFPQDAELYLLEGATESSMGNKDKSEELIRRSIALNPENPVARGALVQNFLMQKKETEALAEIKKAWEEIGVIQELRGVGVVLAMDQGDFDFALDLLRDSLNDIDPGLSLDKPFTLDDEVVGKLTYNGFVNLASVFQEAGDVYHKMGDDAGMARSYESALTITPNSALALNNYAYYLALSGRLLDKALEMSERAVTLDPGNPTYTDTKGWILFMKKDYEESEKVMAETLRLFDEAIENNPAQASMIEDNMDETLIHYGAVLWQLGKHDEARAQWERVLNIDPENAEAKRLIKEGWKE